MLDRRVRLRPKPAAENYVYGDIQTESTTESAFSSQNNTQKTTLLSILRMTNGLVWNFTPNITETMQVNYEMEQPIHTNSGYNNYKNTNNTTITIQGSFYASSGTEALYMLACITFLRSMTKMDFGRRAARTEDPNLARVGSPPPVLLLSAYGRYMYNDIPVIIKSVTFNCTDDVQYILAPVDSSTDIFSWDLPYIQKFYNDERGVRSNPNNGNPVSGLGFDWDTLYAKDTYTPKEVGMINQRAADILNEEQSMFSRAYNPNVSQATSDVYTQMTVNNGAMGMGGKIAANTGASNSTSDNTSSNRIPNKDNAVWVPQKMSVVVQLEQQPTPDYMSKQFNLNDFKRGSLLRRGGLI